MHLIRPEKNINATARVGVGGLVTIKRRDMRTGKVDLVREEKPNMILQPMFDALIGATSDTRQGNFVSWGRYTSTWGYTAESCFRDCAIGSDGTDVQGTDDFILTELARNNSFSNHERSAEFADPVWTSQTWTFPAGTGTGTVREVGVRQSSVGTAINHVARQVVSPEIEKTEYHELEVTWKALFSRGANHPWQTTIVGGQRDGTTDITAHYEMNDRQLMTWCRRSSEVGISTHESNDYTANPIARWNGIVSSPQVVVGTSNTSGDLETDTDYTIHGTELFSGTAPMREIVSKVAGSKVLESRIGFDVGDANGSIGEIVLCTSTAKSTDRSYGGLGRLRFDPPLDKVDSYRLFLNIKFQFEDVNIT